MDAETLDNFAKSLAVCAVTGDRSGLEKHAAGFLDGMYAKAQPYLADPYIRNSLLGLGAGGLVGLAQPKRKLRNALTYGLLGSLGGLGATHLFNGGKLPGMDGKEQSAVAGGAAPADPVAAKRDFVDNASNPNMGRAIGKVTAGVGGARAGYGLGVNAMKSREGMQNLLDVQTNARNANQTATADTVAASRAARNVRDNLQTDARRSNFANTAQRSTAAGLPGSADPMLDLLSGNQRRTSVQALGRDAANATQPSAFRLFGPNNRAQSAVVNAERVMTPNTGVSAQTMRNAISEANRVAPTRMRHRAGGVLGGLGLGLGAQYLGGRAGEWFVNNKVNPPLPAAAQ